MIYDILFITLISIITTIVFGYNYVKQKEKAAIWKNRFQQIQHDKISSEVRVGKIGENMAPFLEDWPYDPNTFRFLGNPVDGIQFCDDEIIFVEIKTGKSRLSKGQKRARDLIQQGKVSFATFRVGETGCEFKKHYESTEE
jgi:predicted Holliday junction resolvase-like endonuclease